MTAAGKTFSAQVESFVSDSKSLLSAVFKESTQRLVSGMQTPVASGGNMPVDTGFLRSSLRLNTTKALPADAAPPSSEAAYSYDESAVSLVIATAKPGDKIYGSYVANYAAVVHFGNSTRRGRQWVALEAQRWPQIVEAVCSSLKSAPPKPSEELS